MLTKISTTHVAEDFGSTYVVVESTRLQGHSNAHRKARNDHQEQGSTNGDERHVIAGLSDSLEVEIQRGRERDEVVD